MALLDKNWWLSELRVIINLFIAVVLTTAFFFFTDIASQLGKLLNGDITKEVLISGISVLILQSISRAITTVLAPQFFNHNLPVPTVNNTTNTTTIVNTPDPSVTTPVVDPNAPVVPQAKKN